MNYKGAVFFDIDGTLIDSGVENGQMSETVRKALRELKENGYLTCIASGRSRSYLPDFVDEMVGCITCNGAVAEICGKTVFEKFISKDIQREFIKYMKENNQGYILENSEKCVYTKTGGKEYMRITENLQGWYASFKLLEEGDDGSDFPITKLQVFFDGEEDYRKMEKAFEGKLSMMLHHYGWFADVAPYGTSKASGIKDLTKMLGIPMENTYAFGDDYNDIEMIKAVAHGVVMTPHAPGLEEYAEYVTGSVAEDGVYTGLKHLGLIK